MATIGSRDETFNVMIATIIIAVVVMLVSILLLWFLTKDFYLDSYFTLEAFFEAQNTAASTTLAQMAFSYSIDKMLPILAIVIVDNLSRILISSFILAAVIDFLSYANVEEVVNEFRVKALKRHVIICGYNGLAEDLIKKLRKKGIGYIVAEPDSGNNELMNERKVLSISRDFTEADTLRMLGIERARAIVFASENDVDNVVGAIVARRLNPRIRILSRLKEEGARKRIYSAGVDTAVIPEHLAGLEIGDFTYKAFGV